MKKFTLEECKAAGQSRGCEHDPMAEIIVAAYHCAWSRAEIHEAIKKDGLDEVSDETLDMLEGQYRDHVNKEQQAQCDHDFDVDLAPKDAEGTMEPLCYRCRICGMTERGDDKCDHDFEGRAPDGGPISMQQPVIYQCAKCGAPEED